MVIEVFILNMMQEYKWFKEWMNAMGVEQIHIIPVVHFIFVNSLNSSCS